MRLQMEGFVHDFQKIFSRGILLMLLISVVYTRCFEQVVLSSEHDPDLPSSDTETQQTFTLRHVLHHGADRNPHLFRTLDIDADGRLDGIGVDSIRITTASSFLLKSRNIQMIRLRDRSVQSIEGRIALARYSEHQETPSAFDWTTDQVAAPDVTDKETVLSLAKMAANAYVHIPATEDWRDIGAPYNDSVGFGWENDGLRGHIFLDETNSTVVVSIKGTSVAVFSGEETKSNDKVNDNLFFSCCCARVSAFWRTVCECYTDTYSCSNPCLFNALREENRYYRAALNLYYNVTKKYPESNVWLVGHSLGGAVSSLLGMTYGLPVVTFEAPPEALPALRLGIPQPPDRAVANQLSGTYHFGNNADPIYMGVCNGVTSFCSIGGYAMETKCHSGKVCLYDVVNDLGWRVNGNSHRIKTVIDEVMPKYERVPECIPEDDECTDCFNWKFHNQTVTSTTKKTKTTTSTSTSTRSTTCKHPGWWGCLDETSTTTTTTKSSTTTSVTCSHYGWFGECLDSTTSTTPTTSTTDTTSEQLPPLRPTQTPNPPNGIPTVSITSTPSATTTATAVPEPCKTPGYFWGCRDPKSRS